jgi:hypothetical protein
MAWHVEQIDAGRETLVEFFGDVTPEDVRLATIRGAKLAKAHSSWRVLVDASDFGQRVRVADLYQLPKLYEALDVPRTLCLAVVEPVGPRNKENARFYETLLKNRGYNVRLFSNRGDAARWLRDECA